MKPLHEAAMAGIGQAGLSLPGVIDIQPLLRQKRFEQRYVWTVSPKLFERIKADLARQQDDARVPPLRLSDLD